MENKFKSLYTDVCIECSSLITRRYSTSFSMGIRAFDKIYRSPIYSIYGFVRFADEIVDTFHDQDKKYLLEKFRFDTYEAIERKISLNPVLEAFQNVVNKYNIGVDLIDAFLDSMEMDLYDIDFDEPLLKKYIYGSAEVVGLMCLKVFCQGNQKEYERLVKPACALGSAFQKVNFLRDMKSDYDFRGRTYFPNVDFLTFNSSDKITIERVVQEEFDLAYNGIKELPSGARLGVYTAYKYYRALFKKIKLADVAEIKENRIRIPNSRKLILLGSSALKNRLNLL